MTHSVDRIVSREAAAHHPLGGKPVTELATGRLSAKRPHWHAGAVSTSKQASPTIVQQQAELLDRLPFSDTRDFDVWRQSRLAAAGGLF